MNVRDAEVIKGLLLDDGFEVTDEEETYLDAVLFITCSVRQHAEDRVWSEMGKFCKLDPKPIIGLVGCMAENYKEKAFERIPGIDLVVGTNDIAEIPDLLKEAFELRGKRHEACPALPAACLPAGRAGQGRARRLIAVGRRGRDELVYRPEFREGKERAFVVISEGCDNFCSYCVVPYVRGELRHRPPENILKEIEFNVAQGIKSLTLIGQNVNAYKYNGTNFIGLLEAVNSIQGLDEFDFITSHPKDIAGHLFETMAKLGKLKKYLHLPAQSGSDRILQLMKRGYSRRRYLDLAGEWRRAFPGAGLTTDIIIGFPGETEEDFQQTLDLLKKVRFNSAYIFKYSPRPNTEAAKLNDDVLRQEKERRHKILLDAQKQISNEYKRK